MVLRLLRFLIRWISGIARRSRREPLPRVANEPHARRAATDDRLRIDYAPRRDGDADPGEIVWAWVPFEEDATQGKDRPVLVIGRRGRELVGVALTSQGGRHDRVEIGAGAWDPQGRTSYAKLDRLIPLSRGIRREGAVLDRGRFDAVTRALARVGRA